MRKILLSLAFILTILNLLNAQYSDKGPEDNYQKPKNPYYWKFRKPFAGYWQQDVHYNIKANIDEATDTIGGEEELTYTNNSPDTV
jgi:hypothetical protein